jgi:transcriptional regulator of acetoin/glycerol metabolism
LSSWSWPGNVRELKNALEYAVAMGDGPVITQDQLPPEVRDAHAPQRSDDDVLAQTLATANGNRDDVAAALGISRVTLWRRMKAAGMAVRKRR